MLCNKCNHEYDTKTCHYCKREKLRKKYSDKYLYDNIVRIEYQDWGTEDDKFDHSVPDRYFQIRDNDEGCGIDVAGYVRRKNNDFDEVAYKQMSMFEQYQYNSSHYHLEYVEESVGLTQAREIFGKDFLKSILAHHFFKSSNFSNESGNEEYSFLEDWPTFEPYADYLRQYEKSNADELSAFELVFCLRNGEQIFMYGTQNQHSIKLVEKLMSDTFIYLQFKDVLRMNEWNYMFNISLERENFSQCIDVVDKCHNGKMAEIKLQDSYFDNLNCDEDYLDIVFECKNKTNKPITIHLFIPTIVTTTGSQEELEDEVLCTLQPGESREEHWMIEDPELKYSYLTPKYLTGRYGEKFENPELFLSKLSFQVFVEQGNDVDIEYSDWELKDTEIVDIADDEYDEENDIATVSAYYDGYIFRLGEGEYRRYRDEEGITRAEYLCIGIYKNNKILFHYVDTTGEIVDYVKTIWSNTPDFAKEYLMDVLNKNENLAVRMTLVPGPPTLYEIYYDGYKDRGLLAEPLIQWMLEHNDFAAENYRYTEIVSGHQRCVGSDEKTEIPNYTSSEILYIYKGNIKCRQYDHHIIQATAILHNKTDHEIELNVEYCTKCKKFILEYTVFEQYRNRYGVLVGNFRMVVNGEFEGEYDLAEESPLMLFGYSVSQRDGYTSRERHYILARIIHDGIMEKGEVIRYLSYFIRKNGAKRGNELALSKWKEDLAFVQEYDKRTQPKAIISDIKKY